MKRSEEGRVEELSKLVGGRFKLTVLIQKQAQEYYSAGRTFMPSVRNFDELFNYILDEIEDGTIHLELAEPRAEAPTEPLDTGLLEADEQL